MPDRLYLIDGHSILNRAFYGVPDLTNSEGIHTNAVYGFLNILFKVIEEEQPEYLGVAFDLPEPTFRHKMYPEYKGTRKKPAPEFRQQVPIIKEVLRAMGIKCISKGGYEADDILGTVSKQGERQGMNVTVISGDRDLLQLASKNITIRIPKTIGGNNVVEEYDEKAVIDKYEVTPQEFIDVKALMGDSSDNIPGLPGVGEKTAVKIIKIYGCIENAFEHASEIKPPRAGKAMLEHYDLAVMSKQLAAIDTNVELDLALEDLKAHDYLTQEAYQLFKKLGFKQLSLKFNKDNEPDGETVEFEMIGSRETADKIFSELSGDRIAFSAVDIGEKSVFSLSLDKTYVFVLDADIDKRYISEKIDSIQNEILLISDNIKDFLKNYSISDDHNIFDTIVAAYLLNPNKSDYSFDDVVMEHLGRTVKSKDEVFGNSGKKDVSQPDIRQIAEFCAVKSSYSLKCCSVLEERLSEAGMSRIFYDIEMPLIFTLDFMEKEGIVLDTDALTSFGKELQNKISEITEDIYKRSGEEFNINSPKQLGVILFEKMKMPFGKKTKTGYSTSASVLEKLAEGSDSDENAVFVREILEYRQLTKLNSTYVEGLKDFADKDSRIHTRFNQTVTATGRLSSTEPNLQNIPVRMELGRLIRKCFVPSKGNIFVDADYSQIELRILAHMSGDEKLIEAYRTNRDIHAATASEVFNVPYENVTPEMRRNAKAVNFGIVYGISSFGLGQGLSISQADAKKYIDDYFKTYPGVKQFIDGLVESAKKNGCAVSVFGRKRPIPELFSGNFMTRSFGERIAMNSPLQSSAADIMKIAMNNVYRRMKREKLRSKMILQIHDELLIDTAPEEKETVEKILVEEMESAADLAVKLEVDCSSGINWYEAK